MTSEIIQSLNKVRKNFTKELYQNYLNGTLKLEDLLLKLECTPYVFKKKKRKNLKKSLKIPR